ncbi:MAG TPA: hypothetical protein VJC00_00195 [Candidatus Nanoarchaeia archaeon]|nr:hypothetical protein [Candidatus Nanoarchaeia archaeon]
MKEDDVEELKNKLRSYNLKEISFSKHARNQIILRESNEEEIASHLLYPDKLVYSYQEKGKMGSIIHCLHFRISNTRTIRLPVIFDKGGKKNLYILTYIMRHRAWQNMVKRGKGR